MDFDDDDDDPPKGRAKSRRELPTGAVATLKAWLLSPEHFTHPYPTPQDQQMLMQQTGIDKKQLKNWFTNARRRIWKPMLKKQIEQGKLTPAPGMPGAVPGLMIPGAPLGAGADNPHSVQAMRVHYQQAMQDQPQQAQQQVASSLDAYGNPIYTAAEGTAQTTYYVSNDGSQQPQQLASSGSIGTLAQLSSSAQLSKTDSHAVLMELFARDQDLVRQATESARLKAEAKQQQLQQSHPGQPQQQQSTAYTSQHPMKAPAAQGALANVPTLNSWPHFSSITSLNNLGTIPGVKSITSLSGADLASKGNVNNMGNLAQVKSMESMGKNDSYAFLEVFFGDRSSTNLAYMPGGGSGARDQRGTKQAGDEDNEIGLSLDDESPQHPIKKEFAPCSTATPAASAPASIAPAPEAPSTQPPEQSGTMKRAFDDALAARGLMSVSRSCEKLTDLSDKIQRTLSQEYINKQQQQQSYVQYSYTSTSANSAGDQQQQAAATGAGQYPGQQAVEPQGESAAAQAEANDSTSANPDGHIQVSSSTTCELCSKTNVDTQLRPCGHMFHERCLKPSLKNPVGPPKCPIDDIPMHSAVLAVPDNTVTSPTTWL